MSSKELAIPPKGIPVRLFNFKSKHVLFSRSSEKPYFGHHPAAEMLDDQQWEIIPGTGSHIGKYLIKSFETKDVLYSRRDNDPNVGTYTHVEQYKDQYFEFEVGTGRLSNFFRIKCPATNSVMVSRVSIRPQVDNYLADQNVHDDQYFSFMPVDLVVESIKFGESGGSIDGTNSVYLGKQTLPNHSSVSQTFTAKFTEQEDKEYSFVRTSGFSLTVGSELKVGIPGIADGKISMSASHSEEFTWGSTTKTGKGTVYDFPVVAPPRTVITAHAHINKSRMTVPYTMTAKSKSTGQTVVSKGTFTGVHLYDVTYTVTEEKLPDKS